MTKKRDSESTFIPTEGTPTVAVVDGASATLVIKDEPQTVLDDKGAEPAAPKPLDSGETAAAPPLVHREVVRRGERLRISMHNAASMAKVENLRAKLVDSAVLYTARPGEYGYCGRGVAPVPIVARVKIAHNSECCDLAAIEVEDGVEVECASLVSCILAGTRDTKAGDPGTFEVIATVGG